MKCILIFDHVNDIIYTKYNKKFALHINEFAKSQGLLPPENEVGVKLGANVVVQIFSPIVTSQRIMSCQFGNSYTSIQCQDGLNMTFEEYMGYLFVCIGVDDVPSMKRFLNVCVTLVRYITGPDVMQLKLNVNQASLLTQLIDCWIYLRNNDQAIFLESIEQLLVNSELTALAIQVLREAVDKLHGLTDCAKIHAMLLVQNKLLALYSSQNAKELSASDILFTIILSNYCNFESTRNELESDEEEEFYSPCTTPLESYSTNSEPENVLYSNLVLLSGSNHIPKCTPHVMHICPITDGINVIFLLETGNTLVATHLYETFLHLHTIQTVQMQRDSETLKPAFENLDASVKKLCDGLKKSKNNLIEPTYKQFVKKWELMKKKYLEFLKGQSAEALLRAESSTGGLLDTLKELLRLTAFDHTVLISSQVCCSEAAKNVMQKLLNFKDFLRVKSMKNFSLGSRDSLTFNKYLEEFPGLVHFIYVDRTNHRITAPCLDFTSEETLSLTKKKIWSMVNFSRTHLEEGHLSIMWKDTTFNYAYFLWFEDISGSSLKPTVFPTHASKALSQPGILCGDFYQKLKEICFPKMSPNKIRCYELYCVHLGLATAQCVLEHTRRLAATIWELKGHPSHPIDLL